MFFVQDLNIMKNKSASSKDFRNRTKKKKTHKHTYEYII